MPFDLTVLTVADPALLSREDLDDADPPPEGWLPWQIRWDDEECEKYWCHLPTRKRHYAQDFLEVSKSKMETLAKSILVENYIGEREIRYRKEMYKARKVALHKFEQNRAAQKIINMFHRHQAHK